MDTDDKTPDWLLLDKRPGSKETSPLARRLAWARNVCKVATESPPDQVRLGLLRELKKHAFVPPEEWSQSSLTLRDHLHGAVEPDDPAVCVWETEQAVKRELSQFTAEFFELSPTARYHRWERLAHIAGEYPLLNTRLDQLQCGLAVEPRNVVGNPNNCHRKLTQYLTELFTLRPALRARRRGELLAEFQPRWAEWREAAEFLQRHHRDIAQLEPALMAQLTAPEHSPARSVRRPVSAATSPATGSNSLAQYYSQYTTAPSSYSPPQTPQPIPRHWSRNQSFALIAGIVIVCVVVVVALIGAVGGFGPKRAAPTGSPSYAPAPTAPTPSGSSYAPVPGTQFNPGPYPPSGPLPPGVTPGTGGPYDPTFPQFGPPVTPSNPANSIPNHSNPNPSLNRGSGFPQPGAQPRSPSSGGPAPRSPF